MPPSSRRLAATPGLLAFAPVLYLAWADGQLTPAEIERISSLLQAEGSLETSQKNQLGAWLDPDDPPSAAELKRLLGLIQSRVSEPGRHDVSVRGLCAALAQSEGRALAPRLARALEGAEAALRVDSNEAGREVLNEDRPRPAPAVAQGSVAADDARRLARDRALGDYLDGDQGPLMQRIRTVLAGPEFRLGTGGARVSEMTGEQYRERVLLWCRRLAREGFGSLSFPRDVGGRDDMAAFMAAFETVALHDLSLLVKFGVQFGLWGGSIQFLGSARHHAKYLPDTASLELPGCFAMSESAHGSNVRDLETTARYESTTQEFVLHTPRPQARKDYIGNAARDGRIATVFAQLEIPDPESGALERHGVHAFVVPIRSREGEPLPGIRIEDCGAKMGLNGVDNGRLYFDRVRVPRANLLDRFASVSETGEYSSPIASSSKRFFTMLGTLVGGRVSVAAAALSASKKGLAIAVRYAARRRQFGAPGEPETPLMRYPSHQRRLLRPLAGTYAAHAVVRHAQKRFLERTESDVLEVEHLAASVKVFATRLALETLQTCREACGGAGYLVENLIPSLRVDADVFVTFEGDNTVLRQLVAKGLLTDYAQQFGEMKLSGMLRFLLGRAEHVLTEKNPVVTRRASSRHLRSDEFQAAAFELRAEHLLSTAARQLRRKIQSGSETTEAFVQCQNQLIALADADADRVVFGAFRAMVENAPEHARADLGRLLDLFALSTLERERAWFLEHGYFSGSKSRALHKEVEALCAELAPRALDLVGAFNIPVSLLDAAILNDEVPRDR